MAKSKTAFLSLGATGSLGGSITAQRLKSTTMLRTKPLPTDPYSLPQAYHRWLYKDYAYLWTKQSAASQAIYRTLGSTRHRTAFQEWMRHCLLTLPYLHGIYHLDELTGSIAYDLSPYKHNGTIYGATLASGRIDRSRYFDGINDRISIPYSADLTALQQGTVECFLTNINGNIYFAQGLSTALAPYFILFRGGYYFYRAPLDEGLTLNWIPNDGLWHHAAWTCNGTIWKYYIDGIQQTLIWSSGSNKGYWFADFSCNNFNLGVLYRSVPYAYHKGNIDHFFIWDIELDSIMLLDHAQRRYPVK